MLSRRSQVELIAWEWVSAGTYMNGSSISLATVSRLLARHGNHWEDNYLLIISEAHKIFTL